MNQLFIDQMKKYGYCRKTLAKSLEVSTEHIRLIEKGKRRPSTELAKRIQILIDLDWTYFF